MMCIYLYYEVYIYQVELLTSSINICAGTFVSDIHFWRLQK